MKVYFSAQPVGSVELLFGRQVGVCRCETRAVIGGEGGEYSYIRVLPDEFLLK